MKNPTLTTRFDSRWPQGMIGPRDTRIVKNARIYLAATDGQVAKIGWGDVCLEQWALLREIAADGMCLVAFECTFGTALSWYDQPEATDATFEDLVPGLAIALDRVTAVLLNYPAPPGRHTLGAITLPVLDRDTTKRWLADRLEALTAVT